METHSGDVATGCSSQECLKFSGATISSLEKRMKKHGKMSPTEFP